MGEVADTGIRELVKFLFGKYHSCQPLKNLKQE